jgi:hypothetical protein
MSRRAAVAVEGGNVPYWSCGVLGFQRISPLHHSHTPGPQEAGCDESPDAHGRQTEPPTYVGQA